MPPTNPFVALKWSQVLTHVGVGMGAASFWRGAWYVLDDHLFPNSAVQSATASLTLGVAGMGASQGLVAHCESLAQKASDLLASKTNPTALAKHKRLMRKLQVARFGAIYTIAMSVVLVWRGTWMGWDVLYEYTHPEQTTKATDPGHATQSGVLSHAVAVCLLCGSGLFASVLAPPAATSIVRDWTVKTGAKSSYVGPATQLLQSLWQPRTSMARNFHNHATALGRKSSKTTATRTHARAFKPEVRRYSTRAVRQDVWWR